MTDHPRSPSLTGALLPIVVTMGLLVYHIFANQGAPHIPLVLGIFVATLFGLSRGFNWSEIQDGIVGNVAISVPVLGIMITVGMTISTWILCGTVPFLTRLGLTILAPTMFLPVTCIVCAIVSVATGTSWGTVGTIGLALLGVGDSMGIPVSLTAGAIVSGAWFGDKMSPLSDTTNFAAAIVGADLYAHIRNMLPSTIPAMLIALLLYAFVGGKYADNALQGHQLETLVRSIDASFSLNFLIFIPPAVILVTVIRKMPALPGIFLGVIAAGIVAMTVQGATAGEVMSTMMTGYQSDTGNAQLDALLSKGGVMSMMWVISLIMIAMAFGGVLEKTRCLDVIVRAILSKMTGRASLITASLLASFGFNLSSNAFVAYTVPGRMFAPAFRGMGLSTTNLSRLLEDGATMTAPLIPWNSGAVFVSRTLGIPTLLYAPFAFANWIAPLFDLLWGWTGYFVPHASEEETDAWAARGETVLSPEVKAATSEPG
ncbi:MAG: Na+/H+ antiporter NhaC [Gammaproteobacteria bacterium]|nr:Na+/H+ antiporter NhaC [Gammaproteobacteria bacterium]